LAVSSPKICPRACRRMGWSGRLLLFGIGFRGVFSILSRRAGTATFVSTAASQHPQVWGRGRYFRFFLSGVHLINSGGQASTTARGFSRGEGGSSARRPRSFGGSESFSFLVCDSAAGRQAAFTSIFLGIIQLGFANEGFFAGELARGQFGGAVAPRRDLFLAPPPGGGGKKNLRMTPPDRFCLQGAGGGEKITRAGLVPNGRWFEERCGPRPLHIRAGGFFFCCCFLFFFLFVFFFF